jgi:hypothetical protein
MSAADHCGDQPAQLGAVGVDRSRTLTAARFISEAAHNTLAYTPPGIDRAGLSSRGSPFHDVPHLIALRI